MGWTIRLTSDKEITPDQIEKAIETLSQVILGSDGIHRSVFQNTHYWGIGVDVYLPTKSNQLLLSGSYSISGKIAEFAAESFARRLEKLGHCIYISGMC